MIIILIIVSKNFNYFHSNPKIKNNKFASDVRTVKVVANMYTLKDRKLWYYAHIENVISNTFF